MQLGDLRRQPGGFHAERDAERHRQQWLMVAAETGAPVPERLAWMHWSTRPASLAARAAELQGPEIAERVLRRLREAVFVVGRPADTPERILDAVGGIDGLDVDRLVDDARSDVVAVLAERDWSEARRPRAEVVGLREPKPCPGAAEPDGDHLRYEFPTLVFDGPEGSVVVPGWRSLSTYVAAIDRVAPGVALGSGVPLDAEAALRHFGSLTRPELVLLTGRDEAPAEAHEVATATGPLWVLPSEAAARGWTSARARAGLRAPRPTSPQVTIGDGSPPVLGVAPVEPTRGF